MHRTQIPPEILQTVLDSASNAADKGLSQFFTPTDFGAHVAKALVAHRPIVADFNCGAGHLLRATANASTQHLLGVDIDPTCAREKTGSPSLHPSTTPSSPTAPLHRLTGDITQLHEKFDDINLQFDLIVLNPPYRLFWHRARLAHLADSICFTVRRAFAAIEPGAIPATAIDSTVASLLMALDRLTLRGEGLLIGNHATLERLLFAPGAPHAAVAQHCWGRLILPGNPMTGLTECNFEHDDTYHTEVLYFARDHTTGPRSIVRWTQPWPAPSLPKSTTPPTAFPLPDRQHRLGIPCRPDYENEETLPLWWAVTEQLKVEAGQATEHPYNLWLDSAGTLRTHLNRYEEASRKTDKDEARRLHALRGKTPLQLVLQRADRDRLLHAARDAGWRVDPALLTAVDDAIRAYHAARAPLYPLPEIQRLGYLDEQDTIECRRHLGPFRAGSKYPLRTQTVKVTRAVTKPNNTTGEPEDLEYFGQELALYLKAVPTSRPADPLSPSGGEGRGEEADADAAPEWSFMDQTLRGDKTTVEDGRRNRGRRNHSAFCTPHSALSPGEHPVDFTLQQLCEHFVIPEVPDVAACDPEGYAHYTAMLDALEHITDHLDQFAAA